MVQEGTAAGLAGACVCVCVHTCACVCLSVCMSPSALVQPPVSWGSDRTC